MGQPLKIYIKMYYIPLERYIYGLFNGILCHFFSPWAKFFMVHLVETDRGAKPGENDRSEFHIL